MADSLNSKVREAAKWSFISEFVARIIAPVTQLILARILSPEAFGVVATVVMVTSFAEMLSDAGFQKYLIQHDFKDRSDLGKNASVAFWSSMVVAILLLAVIALIRDPLAVAVGNPGLGLPILVASCSLPLTVCVSTQQALFRRAFEYKKIFPIKVAVAVVPVVVTVPLALSGMGYWALIIGTLSGTLLNAVALTIVSPWKPSLFYSFDLFRKMFSFSSWSLIEAISIWMTSWAGTFIVGSLLSPYELGLYRQPMTIVNAVFALVTSATTPILFAALSRLQSDRLGFRKFFLRFQLIIATVVFPIGVGAHFYRDFFVEILFGQQWTEASLMFGVWSLSTCFAIVLSHYCSEIYRSLGRPRVSIVAQLLYMCFMIPAVYFAGLHDFTTLVIVNGSIRVVMIIINQSLTYWVTKISFLEILRNLRAPIVATFVMGLIAWGTARLSTGSLGLSMLGILGTALVYLLTCMLLPTTRAILVGRLPIFRHEKVNPVEVRMISQEGSTENEPRNHSDK